MVMKSSGADNVKKMAQNNIRNKNAQNNKKMNAQNNEKNKNDSTFGLNWRMEMTII